MRLTSAALFNTIGWLVTADALIGAFAFVAVWQSVSEFGGQFPPSIIFFMMFPILAMGGFVTYYGARQSSRQNSILALIFPLVALVAIISMLPVLTCVPWALCTNP